MRHDAYDRAVDIAPTPMGAFMWTSTHIPSHAYPHTKTLVHRSTLTDIVLELNSSTVGKQEVGTTSECEQ